jgi:hypothetical protein
MLLVRRQSQSEVYHDGPAYRGFHIHLPSALRPFSRTFANSVSCGRAVKIGSFNGGLRTGYSLTVIVKILIRLTIILGVTNCHHYHPADASLVCCMMTILVKRRSAFRHQPTPRVGRENVTPRGKSYSTTAAAQISKTAVPTGSFQLVPIIQSLNHRGGLP